MVDIRYRHPTEDDIDSIVDVINTSNRDNPIWNIRNPEEFRKTTFEDDEWDVLGHWAVALERDIVGYGGARVRKRSIEHGMKEGWVGFWVLQEHRGRGIEHELMKRSVDYLRGRGLAKAKMYDLLGTEWRSRVREDFDFKVLSYNYIMVHREKGVLVLEAPSEFDLEEFLLSEATEEHLGKLMTAINESFLNSDAPYFLPVSLEFLHKWKDATQSVVRIALGRIHGTVVGECISEIEEEFNEIHGVKTGWIESLGVLKEYRRKGVGKALLVEGMRWLQDKGMDTIYIGVDAQNPTALNMYKSVSFEMHQESAVYGLEL